MNSERIQKIKRIIKEQTKQLLSLLLALVILMTIALIPMAFVWGFSLENEAFLILVIADISVIIIFMIGLIIVGIRHVITDISKRDEISCGFCGETITGGGNVCLNCGKDNRTVTDST